MRNPYFHQVAAEVYIKDYKCKWLVHINTYHHKQINVRFLQVTITRSDFEVRRAFNYMYFNLSASVAQKKSKSNEICQ